MDKPAIITLTIAFNMIWVVPILYELASASISDFKRSRLESEKIRRENEEWLLIHKHPPKRKLCANCKYCRWKWDHAFGYGKRYWSFASKQPLYCKKLKTSLPNNSALQCIARKYSEVESEQ